MISKRRLMRKVSYRVFRTILLGSESMNTCQKKIGTKC